MTLDRTRLAALGRSLRRTTPPARLRIMYWTVSACALVLLVMLHITLLGESRLETELSAATRAALAAPRVLIVRVAAPAVRAAKAAAPNTRHITAAAPEK